MTVRLARIAVDFTQDAKRSGTQAHDWLGREGHLPHSHPKDLAPERTTDLAKAERTWSPAWRLVLVVGTSAGMWTLILVSLSIAGVLRLLP
jgi:hypothetical protein